MNAGKCEPLDLFRFQGKKELGDFRFGEDSFEVVVTFLIVGDHADVRMIPFVARTGMRNFTQSNEIIHEIHSFTDCTLTRGEIRDLSIVVGQ